MAFAQIVCINAKLFMEKHWNNWIDKIIPWFTDHGIKIAVIIVAVFVAKKLLKKVIAKTVRIAVVAEEGNGEDSEKKREDTLIYIFTATANVTLYLVGSLMVLQEMGLMIAPILAGAGIVGLAFGFGGQYLIRDIIAGLFIIIENQYRIGDVIRVEGAEGLVENISLRMTTIRDVEGTVHHIPHGEIKMVSNLSKGFSRVKINLGVSYSTDIDHARRIIDAVGQSMAEESPWKEEIILAPHFVRVDKFADSAVELRVSAETMPHKQWDVAGEFRRRIKYAFDKEGIEIPFPQRVIHTAKGE